MRLRPWPSFPARPVTCAGAGGSSGCEATCQSLDPPRGCGAPRGHDAPSGTPQAQGFASDGLSVSVDPDRKKPRGRAGQRRGIRPIGGHRRSAQPPGASAASPQTFSSHHHDRSRSPQRPCPYCLPTYPPQRPLCTYAHLTTPHKAHILASHVRHQGGPRLRWCPVKTVALA